MEGTTIEVCGVPDILPDDRIVDKLTIHFLRPRNGGGEIIRVIYPTSTKGQAFVAFELQEVASQVAKLKHTLDIDGQQFPLTIEIADRLEVDLPVQATLDISMFPDLPEVYGLLSQHRFKVSELSPGMVLLDGTFLNLRAVRAQLQRRLQDAVIQASRGRCVSAYALNGYDGAYGEQFCKDTVPASRTRTLPLTNGPSSYKHLSDISHARSPSPAYITDRSLPLRRSPPSYFDSASVSSDHSPSSLSSWNQLQPSRNMGYFYEDSGPHSLPIFPTQTLTSKPPLHRRALSPKEITIPVDADAFCYTWSFKKTEKDDILYRYSTESTIDENCGVINLTLKGRECEKARGALQNLFTEVHSSLREQTIPLKDLSYLKQAEIANKLTKLKEKYNVIIKQTEDVILIIGSSTDSYAVKQLALGESVTTAALERQSRSVERKLRPQRSSSLPKQTKLRSVQDDTRRKEAPAAVSVSSTRSPSHYQDQEGIFIGMSRRSSSESRGKEKAQSPLPSLEPEVGSTSSSKMPKMKEVLGRIVHARIKDSLKDKRSNK